VPKANAPKKSRIGDLEIIGVERLADAIAAAQ
jgi:DNA repair protein RadA/Sms